MLELGIEGKVAVITGGSDGLGFASALRLGHEGCKLAICARREDHLQEAAKQIRQITGAEVLAHPADVTEAQDIDQFITATIEQFGGVDILVNNAGTSAAAHFEEVDDVAWQADIDLKLMAAVRFCRSAVPSMRKRGWGSDHQCNDYWWQSTSSWWFADNGDSSCGNQPDKVTGERIRTR